MIGIASQSPAEQPLSCPAQFAGFVLYLSSPVALLLALAVKQKQINNIFMFIITFFFFYLRLTFTDVAF